MVIAQIVIFGFTILHSAVKSRGTSLNIICTSRRCFIDQPELRFIVIGDWGGIDTPPFISPQQTRVATEMVNQVKSSGLDFIVSVGDNFYTKGVKTANSTRFQDTFENVYSDENLNVPWYITAGNHDHKGSVEAQIAYSSMSSKWKYPDFNYKVLYTLKSSNTTIEIVMVDSVIMCGGKSHRITPYEPSNSTKPQKWLRWKQSWDYVETALNESRADYLFVATHYPIYSVGNHGPTKCLLDRLNPLLQQYRVSALIAGHEHNLQHYSFEYQDVHTNRFTTIHHMISGIGSRTDENPGDHSDEIPKGSLRYIFTTDPDYPDKFNGTGGFLQARINKSIASFKYILGSGSVVHEVNISPRDKDFQSDNRPNISSGSAECYTNMSTLSLLSLTGLFLFHAIYLSNY